MELFYSADSKQPSTEIISDLNTEIFNGWDDGDMPLNDSDDMPNHIYILTEEEIINNDLSFYD